MPRDEAQNRIVECLGAGFRRTVSAAFQYDALGARYQTRQLLGEVGRRQNVVLRADNQRRRLDARQIRSPVEVYDGIDPAGHDLGRRKIQDHGFLALFKQANVLVYPQVRVKKNGSRAHLCRGSCGGEQRAACFKHAPKKWVRLGPTRVDDQALQPVGVFCGKRLPDRTSSGMTDEMRLLDGQVIHDVQQVIGHLFDRIASIGAAALSGATMIVNNDLMALRESRDVRIPVAANAAKTWNEEDRSASPMRLVIDFVVARTDQRHGQPNLLNETKLNRQGYATGRSLQCPPSNHALKRQSQIVMLSSCKKR